MRTLVTARLATRAFSFESASMLEALEKGLALLSEGMEEVRIVEGDRARSVAEFGALLREREASRPAAQARAA